MVVAQAPETTRQRVTCAVACGLILFMMGVPVCGITAQGLGLGSAWAISGAIGFGLVGAWFGYGKIPANETPSLRDYWPRAMRPGSTSRVIILILSAGIAGSAIGGMIGWLLEVDQTNLDILRKAGAFGAMMISLAIGVHRW